jgi:hypothetical protein
MTWEAIQCGLTALVAKLIGTEPEAVAWEGEPVGARDFPQVDLKLWSRSAPEVSEDEVRYVDQGDDTDLAVQLLGERVLTVTVVARAREQLPDARAWALLERLRDRLALPSSLAALAALGLAFREVGDPLDLSDVRNQRQESVAALELQLNYTSCVADPEETVGTIEHVEIGGTAHDGATTITVPEQILP